MEYLLLGIAIVFEILASSMLQSSAGFTKLGPSLACILFYSICFYAFSKALLRINLSIAYASWCAIGIVATTIISICIFNQKMSAVGFFRDCIDHHRLYFIEFIWKSAWIRQF